MLDGGWYLPQRYKPECDVNLSIPIFMVLEPTAPFLKGLARHLDGKQDSIHHSIESSLAEFRPRPFSP